MSFANHARSILARGPRPAWVLATLAAALPAAAQKVTVTPGAMAFEAGTTVTDAATALDADGFRARFQFRATWDGDGPQPRWLWSVVAEDGATPAPQGGSITQEGLYTPPRFSLSNWMRFKVKATDPGDRNRSGTATVKIRPHRGLASLEAVLGQHWRAGRVEFLAGGPEGGAMVDSASGQEARFQLPWDIAFVPRLTWKDEVSFSDQWLVTDGGSVRLVGPEGGVRTLATARLGAHTPMFSRVAARPWRGPEDGDWECYLYNHRDRLIYRMDAHGRFNLHADDPGRPYDHPDGHAPAQDFPEVTAMVADRQGTLYLAQSPILPGRPSAVIRRITRDGAVTVLAGKDEMTWTSLDGKGEEGTLADCNGLALDEASGTLYAADKRCLRAISLATGKVATVPGETFPIQRQGLAFHAGCLLAWDPNPPILDLIEPATGRRTQVFQNPPLQVWTDIVDVKFRPGPCFGAPGVAPSGCGTVGWQPPRCALGADGRIGLLCEGRVGLLLLDWDQHRASLGLGSAPGEQKNAPPAGSVETKIQFVSRIPEGDPEKTDR